MTFDDTHEPSSELRAAMRQLYDAARADQDAAVAEALREASERQAVAVDQAAVLARAEGKAAGREEARAELRDERRKEEGALHRLADAVRDIDAAHSLSLILDALVVGARREAASVTLVVVDGGHLRTWRASDLDPALAADRSLLETALRERQIARADSGTAAVLPVMVSGQVVAALYCDEAAGERQSSMASLEILARYAGRALEVVTAFRTAAVVANAAPEIADFRL